MVNNIPINLHRNAQLGLVDEYDYPVGWNNPLNRHLMAEVVWRRSRGRDVIYGYQIDLDDVVRHHIEHDLLGNTIKTNCRYDNIVASDIHSNGAVEGRDWAQWQAILEIAQTYLDHGLPPPHWSLNDQREFIRDGNRVIFQTLDFYI